MITNIAPQSQDRPIEGRRLIEKNYSIAESAELLGLKYHMAYRLLRKHPKALVIFEPKRFKRPKRFYRIPESVLLEEYSKLTSANRTAA